MGGVLVALIGLTVDFTRAQSIRATLQNGADGAALVAERSSAMSLANRTAAARAFFDAEVGDGDADISLADVHFTVTPLAAGGHRVEAYVDMPVTLARLISTNDWRIGVSADAMAQVAPPIEVAMVLDNTGSMQNDMQALRDAADDLANSLYDLAVNPTDISVAVVPFVAQVNVGTGGTQMSWMDTAGTAPYNGELLEDRQIARVAWVSNAVSGNTCQRLNTLPFSSYPTSSPYRVVWRRFPTSGAGYCYAFTPDTINHFALFDLLPNVDWGGCVEMRPEPYDVTDIAPSPGTPATMFVPYFWIDVRDGQSSGFETFNSYLTDTSANITSATMTYGSTATPTTAEINRAHTFNVFKYRNVNASSLGSGSQVLGPNRGCPTPITPLTNEGSRNTVISAIAALREQFGGGTNQAAGLFWGWSVLSPTAPFTQGRVYDTNIVRKVLFLMTDGENTNVGADTVLSSDYSSLNFRGLWSTFDSGTTQAGAMHGDMPSQYRHNFSSDTDVVNYINDRERLLCSNIKATGIEIYTVVFREPDETTRQLLRDCATDDDHAFTADSQAELAAVFQAVGTGIGKLRITN
jgi:hypothetical protein